MNLMRSVEHPLTGPERHVGPLVEMSETETGTDRSAPPLDSETDAILLEHGFEEPEIVRLRASGAIGAASST
jgi:crotonobetainyl-CoA:carnitine CoA-transferase CaiB-like acyl-CoA transferase